MGITNRRRIGIALAILSTVGVACLCTGTSNPLSTEPEATSEITQESQPSVTATEETADPNEDNEDQEYPTATFTVASTPEPTDEPANVIPGLNPADVTVNLEERDFECFPAEGMADGYVRSCTRVGIDYQLRADIYSPTLFSVGSIDSGAIFFGDPDDELALSYLGFIATMPYEGSNPDEAREWVELTLPTLAGQGDVRETSIGGVDFVLYGIPTARTLEIGIFDE